MGLLSSVSGSATKLAQKFATQGFSSVLGSSNWLPLAGSLAGGTLSALGGAYSANKSAQTANNINILNYKQAKEFAQNQIQWKVADAKAAGLHPLAALGVSPYAAPASAVGGDTSGLGQGLSEMGQNLSRSIDAMQSREDRIREQEKQDALQNLKLKLELDKFANDQAETKSRIALNSAREALTKTETANAVKSASVRAQPRIPSKPRIQASPDGSERHPYKDYAWFVDRRGNKYMTTSKDRAEATQNSWIADIPFYINEAYRDVIGGFSDWITGR